VGSDWDNILIAQANDKTIEGKSIAGAAKERGEDAWTTFFELLSMGGVSVNPKSMNEEQKHLALRIPFVSFCTDAPPTNIESATGAHPRAFGSFPRVLAQYVRQDRVIGMEEAVRKMTSLAANRLNLFERGRIRNRNGGRPCGIRSGAHSGYSDLCETTGFSRGHFTRACERQVRGRKWAWHADDGWASAAACAVDPSICSRNCKIPAPVCEQFLLQIKYHHCV
jgi:hypothetical protein